MASVYEEWQHALLSYELAQRVYVNSMSLDTDTFMSYPTNTGEDPLSLDEQVLLDKKVTIPAVVSHIVAARTKKTFMMGHQLNIMIQPLYPEDKAKLPIGLYIQRVYTELKDGSQGLSMVLQNGTGKPIHLATGKLVGHIITANRVLDAISSPKLEAKSAPDREKTTALTSMQHQALLMEVLEKNGRSSAWSPVRWAASTQWNIS